MLNFQFSMLNFLDAYDDFLEARRRLMARKIRAYYDSL